MSLSLSRNARPELRATPALQQSCWASGDYAVVGNALQLVGEELCDSVNLCQDQRVLDGLQQHLRPDQRLLDLARLPESVRRLGQYEGLCW